MTSFPRFLAAAGVALLAFAAPQASRADEFSGAQRSEVERIVREYKLFTPALRNPQSMRGYGLRHLALRSSGVRCIFA